MKNYKIEILEDYVYCTTFRKLAIHEADEKKKIIFNGRYAEIRLDELDDIDRLIKELRRVKRLKLKELDELQKKREETINNENTRTN